jgi:hypothetical protein
VSALEDIVDRAIDYTNRILRSAPSYKDAAITGLHNLRDALAQPLPDHPAIHKLDAYLDSLNGGAAP